MAIDSQVCFHRWLFSDPVKLHWCIMWPVESLGHNWLGAKLLPMSISNYPMDCVHLCCLLRAQYHCLCPNGGEGLPSTCSPTTTPPLPAAHTLLIHSTQDITGVIKTISNTSMQCSTYTANLTWLQSNTENHSCFNISKW